MDEFDYGGSAQTAQRLINRFGREVTLTPPSSTKSDPSRPFAAPLPAAEINPKAVVNQFDRRLVADGVVQAQDKRVVVASLDLEGQTIESDWSVTDGSERYRVVSVDEKRPGDTSIVFILQVRK